MKFRVLQDNLRNTLWERIEEGDLTGLRLAQQTGFKQAHISNFLNRKRGLSLEGMDRVLAVQHLSVLDLLDPSEAEARLQRRFVEINVWRPIKGPVESWPLALCDARTVEEHDLVASDLVYKNRVGETYSVTYNPAHKWYYAPELRRDEALLLKIMDSKTDGRARFMPHTSFTDPTTPADAFPRESIELRTLVFHPN